MQNMAYMEQKCHINIILVEPDQEERTGRRVVRKKPILLQKTTVNLLIGAGQSQKLREPIENFTLLMDGGIPEFFICDVNPKCKYKTDRKANLVRHKAKCIKMSLKTVTCKQKAYGDDETVLTKMVNKKFIL